MDLFDTLGFSWDRPRVPVLNAQPRAHTLARYRQALPQFVYDAGALEGNPFTFPEVKTLMDGITVGGRKLSDAQQVQNLSDAARCVERLVQKEEFFLTKQISDTLHGLVADKEALEWGHFRGQGAEVHFTPAVHLGDIGPHYPLPTQAGAPNLISVYEAGLESLETHVSNPLERALAYFLFGALQQFYFDGNKRTARFMMNGLLLSEGLDAISVPATRATEFNAKMVAFYDGKNGTDMMAFLIDCRP